MYSTYHSNAPGQSNEDETVAETFLVGEKRPSKTQLSQVSYSYTHFKFLTYHHKRSGDPIDNDAEAQLYPDLTMRKDPVQRLVLDLAEYGIHHDQEAHSCRLSVPDAPGFRC
jgi:hypothetical protein